METKSLNGKLIVRYLLGDLPEEEQARLEDLAFSDREYLQNIQAVESDLIDEYVRGELSDSERRQFERRFLASFERQQKVEFARALAKIVPEAGTEEAAQPAMAFAPTSWWDSFIASLRGLNPAFKFSMAAAAVMLVIGASWLITETLRLRAEVAQLQAQQQSRQRQEEILQQQAASARERSEDLAAQLERERERRERSEELARQLERDQSREKGAGLAFIASLFLPPGIPRGDADRPKLVLPRTARGARLQIGLERGDEYESFRAELHTHGGRKVWSQDNLRARTSRAGRSVILNLPVSLLDNGEYELALKGVIAKEKVEDVGYYYFDVLKK